MCDVRVSAITIQLVQYAVGRLQRQWHTLNPIVKRIFFSLPFFMAYHATLTFMLNTSMIEWETGRMCFIVSEDEDG